MKALLSAASQGERREASERITHRLTALEVWRSAGPVLAFASMPEETDTDVLIAAALESSKDVYLPRVVGDEMEFRRIRGMGELVSGPYGIREPHPDATLWSESGYVLILCPGLAFDRHGRRLGRGKAYYDRFLSGLNRSLCTVIGICFERQLVDQVPAGVRDQPMDLIVTESRTIRATPIH